MKKVKSYIGPFIFVMLVALICFSVGFSLRRPNSFCTEICQNPFYQPKEMLNEEGIEIIAMNPEDENALEEQIRTFFVEDYRKQLRENYEGMPEDVLSQALIAPPIFSKPRKYEGLNDVVGVIASTTAYIPGQKREVGAAYVFFFRVSGDVYSLEDVLPVGEDRQTYEVWPVMRFKEGQGVK